MYLILKYDLSYSPKRIQDSRTKYLTIIDPYNLKSEVRY